MKVKNTLKLTFQRLCFLGLALTFSSEVVANEKERGVEFHTRPYGLSYDAYSSFSKQLVETFYHKKTGVNELRFSHVPTAPHARRNQSRPIFYILGQRKGETLYKKWDYNLDGFYDEIHHSVKGKSYVYEKLYTYGTGRFHRVRQRYFPQKGSSLFKVEVAFRDSEKGAFQVKGGYSFATLQFMNMGQVRPECMSTQSFDLNNKRMMRTMSQLISDEGFGIQWFDSELSNSLEIHADFETSCDAQVKEYYGEDNISFRDVYAEAINEGLNCLGRLSNMEDPENNSFSRILYLNATASLAGQAVYESPTGPQSVDDRNPSFPARAPQEDLRRQQVICSQTNRQFQEMANRRGAESRGEDILGMASVFPGESTHIDCQGGRSVEIEFPFISLNFEVLNNTNYQGRRGSESRHNKLKELIFHEFLHTTGIEHQSHYDPVYACAVHCFNGTQNAEAQRLAKNICEGEGMGPWNDQTVQTRSAAQMRFKMSLMGNNRNARKGIQQRMYRELSELLGRGQARRILNNL